MMNGQVFCKDALTTKGDYLEPFSKEELIGKFNKITKGVWSEERRKEIIGFFDQLEANEEFAEVFRLLVKIQEGKIC